MHVFPFVTSYQTFLSKPPVPLLNVRQSNLSIMLINYSGLGLSQHCLQMRRSDQVKKKAENVRKDKWSMNIYKKGIFLERFRILIGLSLFSDEQSSLQRLAPLWKAIAFLLYDRLMYPGRWIVQLVVQQINCSSNRCKADKWAPRHLMINPGWQNWQKCLTEFLYFFIFSKSYQR